MAFLDYLSPITTIADKIFNPIISLISEGVEDKDKKNELLGKIEELKITSKLEIEKLSIQLQIESPFYRNWRPLGAYISIGILGLIGLNNYILWPYLAKYGIVQVVVPLDYLAILGSLTGLYTILRSVDKNTEAKQLVVKNGKVVTETTEEEIDVKKG